MVTATNNTVGDTLRDLCELSSRLYPQEWGSQCLGLQAWPPPGPILNNLRKTYHGDTLRFLSR